MKICILLLSAYLCIQPIYSVTDKTRLRECRMGRCKIKLNRRLRLLRDLSKSFYPETNIIDIALKTLHNKKGGSFGKYDVEGSNGLDIPKIVCPKSEETGTDMLACPTPDRRNRIHCIDYFMLCDHNLNCPNGEDEDPTMCLFESATDMYIGQLKSSIRNIYKIIQTILPE